LEDAIAQAGVNTADRKYAQIGINVDSHANYLPDQDKYDFEGPKNLFDQNLLCDYLLKTVNDHPLLTYIEDPFAQGDINGYQKIMMRFKGKGVTIAVKNWFGSNLDELKKHTQIIPPAEEDEEAKDSA